MKELRAYFKPHKLDAVLQSLSALEGLSGLSFSRVEGFGRGRGTGEGSVVHVRLEAFCSDELALQAAELIRAAAHTGLRGDGKIYLIEVADALRISTGERGNTAI